jgi:long-subunit acyl-CoA synthetase (AMP-forming)
LISEEIRKECADPEALAALEKSLAGQLQAVNVALDPHERVAFIAIVDGPWTVGNDLMTPTLKLKRSALESRYQELIDGWQGQNQPVFWESAP